MYISCLVITVQALSGLASDGSVREHLVLFSLKKLWIFFFPSTQDRPTIDGEQVNKKMNELKTTYEDMKLLSAKRQQRLQQSLKYFK